VRLDKVKPTLAAIRAGFFIPGFSGIGLDANQFSEILSYYWKIRGKNLP